MTPANLLSVRSSLVAVALLQSAALGWMVFDRVSLLTTGREIRAAVVPVDPRDIFRGDYVTLGYGFSTGADLALPDGVWAGSTLYATLKPDASNDWTLTSVSATKPQAAGDGTVVLKGIVDFVRPGAQPGAANVGRLRYGIERFYVPEGKGREIEAKVREKRIVAVLAVGGDGKVALKGLEADGQTIAVEPLL